MCCWTRTFLLFFALSTKSLSFRKEKVGKKTGEEWGWGGGGGADNTLIIESHFNIPPLPKKRESLRKREAKHDDERKMKDKMQ